MYVILHMLSLLSFKNQWMQFPRAVKAHLVSSGWISTCCHCCFTKQWMLFFPSCHCSLSKNNGCCFLCILTSHLRGSRWIFICCHCCFTKQWMCFSTCCQWSLSKSSGFGFLYVFIAHLISSGWISMLLL